MAMINPDDIKNIVSQQETNMVSVGKAIKVIVAELKNDPQYYQAWQANIAMAFYDNARWNKVRISKRQLVEISNKSADYFLSLLMKGPEQSK